MNAAHNVTSARISAEFVKREPRQAQPQCRTILIVECYDDLRLALYEVMAHEGFACRDFASIEAALKHRDDRCALLIDEVAFYSLSEPTRRELAAETPTIVMYHADRPVLPGLVATLRK